MKTHEQSKIESKPVERGSLPAKLKYSLYSIIDHNGGQSILICLYFKIVSL